MPKYGISVDNFTTPTTTADTAASLEADAAGEEAEIVELGMFGAGKAAAADRQHQAAVFYWDGTTQGTHAGTPTPELFQQNGRVSQMAADTKYSAEPTNINAVSPVLFGFNQRGGMRWAVPRGEGLRIHNADTEQGLVWTVVSDAAGAIDAMINWWEN